MKKAILLSMITLLAPSASLAKCNALSCTGRLEQVSISESVVHVNIQGDESALNCTLVGQSDVDDRRYLTLSKDHRLFNEVFAAFLAAKTTARAITIRIVEGSDRCQISYVVLP